ncbi:hypothetical protein BGZ72_002669 [Mortierella alpina]|nr:hypothetical protein BGZ72_002669 [Mortierella alpina]
MSTFTPPADDSNNCFLRGGSCDLDERCFIYNTGSICQKYTPPAQYPVTGTDAQNTTGWYLSLVYPAVRYTGSLVNQTQGAACTTIPVPPFSSFDRLIDFIVFFELGKMQSELDKRHYNTLVQYRGNCLEGYYCNPNSDPKGQPLRGQLPGTCQPVKADGEPCMASNMCSNWHIEPDRSYNEQYRCVPLTVQPANWTAAGTCSSLNVGSGVVTYNDNRELQSTARTYLLSTLLLFCLVFLFMWYRRQKARQRARQNMMLGDNGSLHDNMGHYMYQQRVGGVNRRPDENDNGELPTYGMHRRDERVTGPAAEEIGMYSFASGNPPPPVSPNGPYPPSSTARPVQQNYPFPMTHPAMMNTMLAPSTTPGGALYPPPSSAPTPLTAQQAEAAAIAAAAAAALPTPRPAAASLQEGGLLPPAYEPSTTQSSEPSTTNTAAATVAELSMSGAQTVNTDGTTKVAGDQTDEKRAQEDHHQGSLLPDSKEKPLFAEDDRGGDEKDTDQVSTSSRSAASGSGSSSAVHSISGASTKKQE